jgi:hypothetical protein
MPDANKRYLTVKMMMERIERANIRNEDRLVIIERIGSTEIVKGPLIAIVNGIITAKVYVINAWGIRYDLDDLPDVEIWRPCEDTGNLPEYDMLPSSRDVCRSIAQLEPSDYAAIDVPGVKSFLAKTIEAARKVLACPNDTNGDGDCHLCHKQPGGCPNK